MNWKKYLKISVIIILVIALGAAVYFLFQKNPAVQQLTKNIFPSSEKTAGEAGQQTETAAVKFGALTATPIFDYWINSKNGGIYYLNEAGQAIKNTNGVEETANSQTLVKLNKVTASPDGTYAVAKFNYPTFPTFSIFNTVTNSWQPLPQNTIAAAWSPDSQKIAYVDDKALNILNLLTQKTQEIIKLSQKEMGLDWRSDNQILISSNYGMATKIISLTIDKKTLAPFMEESGLEINWSDDKQLGIKLNSVNGKPITSLIDANGSVLSQLTFLTLPSKCLIQHQQSKIYCAVPKNIPDQIKLPEDYYKKAIYFDDAIYLINLSNAGVSEIPTDSNTSIDAEHLEISGGKLLFKNRLDGKLYSLTI